MSWTRSMLALSSAAFAVGCASPPPAPQGLDEAASYMVREFYSDDATFQAGIQGFMDWFDLGSPNEDGDFAEPGRELLGLKPGQEGKEVDAFTVNPLKAKDIEHLPLVDQVVSDVQDGEEIRGPRDISLALGVVSLAEMGCDYARAEALLVRPDQDNVFDGDWAAYARTYSSGAGSRAAWEEGMASRTFAPIDEPLQPFKEDNSFADGFAPLDLASTLLFTDNIVDPTPVTGIDLPAYDLNLDLRHGVFELELADETGGNRAPQEVRVFAILTYNPDAVYSQFLNTEYGAGLKQSYSIEIAVERPNKKTLRMLAVWAEIIDPLGLPEGLKLTEAVGKSLNSSNRLTEICEGRDTIDDEP
ncbi:MAG: hypothetical protein H6732_19785 [Alphaproteobacteria bacterium]|nr:hypothetical protein [Alphaproteobacteria bacterium]